MSVLAVSAQVALTAQNSQLFRMALAEPDTLSGAAVRVIEHGTASEIMREYSAENREDQVIAGYRITIFFANNQSARQNATLVQEKFRTQFPEIPTYLFYETPSFKVTVGNCMDIDEALMLMGRVRRHYPSAFLWRGNIPVREFLKSGDKEEEEFEEEEIVPEEQPDSVGISAVLEFI